MGAYYDEVEIEDMAWDEEKRVYHYPCPCGDRFEISRKQLANYEDIATCPSCSLVIRVIYDPVCTFSLLAKTEGLNLSTSSIMRTSLRTTRAVRLRQRKRRRGRTATTMPLRMPSIDSPLPMNSLVQYQSQHEVSSRIVKSNSPTMDAVVEITFMLWMVSLHPPCCSPSTLLGYIITSLYSQLV